MRLQSIRIKHTTFLWCTKTNTTQCPGSNSCYKLFPTNTFKSLNWTIKFILFYSLFLFNVFFSEVLLYWHTNVKLRMEMNMYYIKACFPGKKIPLKVIIYIRNNDTFFSPQIYTSQLHRPLGIYYGLYPKKHINYVPFGNRNFMFF